MSDLSATELDDAYGRGRTAWPLIALKHERFSTRAIELTVSPLGLQNWASDFYLACAAGEGIEKAIDLIDQRYVAHLTARIRRLGARSDDTADVLQLVRQRLFVGNGARIRAYNARSPLEQWIKLVGIRTAVDRHRAEEKSRRVARQSIDNPARAQSDVAETLFKHRYRAEFALVLARQLASLSPRDRTVIRLHLVDGLSLEAIAASKGIHRVTVARWLWRAGESMLAGLQRHFKETYGMPPKECQSLAHLLQSQLSLDLAFLLDASASA
jgi:RNA polymerase sigma-70 factor (ECF subfamily)